MNEHVQLSFDWLSTYEEIAKSIKPVGKFRMKRCTKCNTLKEATTENFIKATKTKDKLHCHCKSCHCNTSKQYKLRKRTTNSCLSCRNSKLEHTSYCLFHFVYYKILSQQKYGRFKNQKSSSQKKEFTKKLIEKLELQNYKCAITGEELVLGVNTSLDHIQEICNGGSCEIENLQWVTKRANCSKPRKYKND